VETLLPVCILLFYLFFQLYFLLVEVGAIQLRPLFLKKCCSEVSYVINWCAWNFPYVYECDLLLYQLVYLQIAVVEKSTRWDQAKYLLF
jgi:hypothetical protein